MEDYKEDYQGEYDHYFTTESAAETVRGYVILRKLWTRERIEKIRRENPVRLPQ